MYVCGLLGSVCWMCSLSFIKNERDTFHCKEKKDMIGKTIIVFLITMSGSCFNGFLFVKKDHRSVNESWRLNLEVEQKPNLKLTKSNSSRFQSFLRLPSKDRRMIFDRIHSVTVNSYQTYLQSLAQRWADYYVMFKNFFFSLWHSKQLLNSTQLFIFLRISRCTHQSNLFW